MGLRSAAVGASDDELPDGYLAWVKISCKQLFIEDFESDVAAYYGSNAVYKLIASCEQSPN